MDDVAHGVEYLGDVLGIGGVEPLPLPLGDGPTTAGCTLERIVVDPTRIDVLVGVGTHKLNVEPLDFTDRLAHGLGRSHRFLSSNAPATHWALGSYPTTAASVSSEPCSRCCVAR